MYMCEGVCVRACGLAAQGGSWESAAAGGEGEEGVCVCVWVCVCVHVAWLCKVAAGKALQQEE
jgi:hypothetical protein